MEWVHDFYKLFCWVSCDFPFEFVSSVLSWFGSWMTGVILSIQAFFIVLASPVAGRFSDRMCPKIIAAVGFLL